MTCNQCDCCACRAARSIGSRADYDGWCNESGLKRGMPYDGAIVNADGELVIPRHDIPTKRRTGAKSHG